MMFLTSTEEIFLTSTEEVSDEVFAFQTGADDFIRKPFSQE